MAMAAAAWGNLWRNIIEPYSDLLMSSRMRKDCRGAFIHIKSRGTTPIRAGGPSRLPYATGLVPTVLRQR